MQQRAAITMALRETNVIEIFQHLDGQITSDAADAIEIGRYKCAVRTFRRKTLRDLFQLTKRCRQKKPI